MNPRVSTVTPTADYKLELVFDDGDRRVYDCSHLLDFGVFQELRDVRYFKRATVLDGTVVWPHEQDVCPDTLYLDSSPLVALAKRLTRKLDTALRETPPTEKRR